MQPIYNTLLGRDPVLWLKAQLRQQQLTHGEEEEMPEHLCTELSFSRPALLGARLGISWQHRQFVAGESRSRRQLMMASEFLWDFSHQQDRILPHSASIGFPASTASNCRVVQGW